MLRLAIRATIRGSNSAGSDRPCDGDLCSQTLLVDRADTTSLPYPEQCHQERLTVALLALTAGVFLNNTYKTCRQQRHGASLRTQIGIRSGRWPTVQASKAKNAGLSEYMDGKISIKYLARV